MKRQAGFSVVELMIVCVIIVVLSTIAIPQIQRITTNYRIDASGHAVASLLAQARLQAVHNNAPAYAQKTNTTSPSMAFVNNDGTSAYVTGDPDVAISSSLKFQDPGALDHKQLDAYLGVTGVAGGPSLKILTPVGFNARGLPCIQNGTPAVCLQQDGPAGPVPGFEWFITDANGNWEAVTVTAGGRIKAWRFTGQGSWQ